MTEGRGDWLGRIVLPSLCLESDDAPALLDDRRLGIAVQRAARAQVVDRQADRLGQRQGAELARHTHNRRRFEEGAGHAAVDGGQDRVADGLWRERHDQVPSSPTRMPRQRAKGLLANGLAGSSGASTELRIVRLWGENPDPTPSVDDAPTTVVATIQTLTSRL